MNKRSEIKPREKIVAAAMKVFAGHGYAKASMRMIAGEAGVSVGALYLHFKSKEELCLTLVRESLDESDRRLGEALRGVSDPVEAIRTYIVTSILYIRSRQELILLQGRELGIDFGIEIKREFFKRRRKLLEEIITKGMESAVFAQCSPASAAGFVMSAMRGFVRTMMLREEGLFTPAEYADFILNSLLIRGDR